MLDFSATDRSRRLPAVPVPLPRESLLSWLGHLSAVYEIPRTSMATACGLLGPGDNTARIADSGPTSLMYGLSDEDVLRVEQATGLAGDELQAMTWLRFLGTAVKFDLLKAAPRNIFRAMKASWIDPRELKFCPSCVKENDGRWPLEWCTPWMFACLRHDCYLLAACPACNTPLPGAHANLDQGGCHGSEKHRLTDVKLWQCGIEYTKWEAPGLQDEVLADLQRFLEGRLRWAHPAAVQLRGMFADLAAMADFALHAAYPEHFDAADPIIADSFAEFCASSPQGNYRTRISDPKPMARTAALRVAAQILFSDDPWSAARAIVDFASRPLPVRALPLNQAWSKRPPQDTTPRLARIVESVRVAAPSVRGLDGRVVR